MQGKPTRYNGILFATETQARWAAFFACLEVAALYRERTVAIRDSVLDVDFWLPHAQAWVEVASPANTAVDIYKHLVEVDRRPLFLIFGQPFPGRYHVRLIAPNTEYPLLRKASFAEHFERSGLWLAEGRRCAPFRKNFRSSNETRNELIVHSGRILESMISACSRFPLLDFDQ